MIDAYAKNQLLYALALIILTSTSLGGISIYMAEHNVNDNVQALSDDLVGFGHSDDRRYGDISPITSIGRIVAGALMIAGMFTLALFAGIVGQTLLSSVLSLREEQFRMSNTWHLVFAATHLEHVYCWILYAKNLTSMKSSPSYLRHLKGPQYSRRF